MTSRDIYYRLGHIESDIEHLKKGQSRLEEKVDKLDAKISSVKSELKAEISSVKSELHSEIKQLGSYVQQLAELGIKTNAKIDALENLIWGGLSFFALLFAAVTFAVTFAMFRDSRQDKKSAGNTFFFQGFRRYKKF